MHYWLWLLCGTALLMVEIAAPHFVTIWFALAAILTGVSAYWIEDLAVQLAIFAVSSVLLFSFGWGWLRKNLEMSGAKGKRSAIGEAGTVVSANVGHPPAGKVRFQVPINGEDVWDYVSDERLSPGDRCEVTELLGNSVKVRKA